MKPLGKGWLLFCSKNVRLLYKPTYEIIKVWHGLEKVMIPH